MHNQNVWDKKLWASYLRTGVKSKAFRGFGRNFVQAVGKLTSGIPPERSGSRSAGSQL